MTLQSSGPISLSQVATEFGGKNPLELGEYRGQDNAPTSGGISLANFYGTDGIPPSGLQYHYDGQISEHNDPSAGNVQDLGSSNYTGTLTNGAAYNSGNFGKVVFDGVDDYVNLSGYNGVTGTGARTSIVFFKLDASPPSAVQRLLTWGDPATNGGKWAMEINTSGQFSLGVGGGAQQSNKVLTTTNWQMVAATWNGGSGGAAPSAIFNFIMVGTSVSGTGVPANTTVTAFNSSAGTITLSNNLTSTISNVTLTFTNNYLIAGGGGGGVHRSTLNASGGSSSGLGKDGGGNGGIGGNGPDGFSGAGGGGGGAAGYSGNGGRGCDADGSPSATAGAGGGGGGGGRNDGGGGVGIYGAGANGTSGGTSTGGGGGSGGTSGSSSTTSGAAGGTYGGAGGGARGGYSSGGIGRPGAVRFVWGSNSYPSNAANGISTQQTFTSSGTFTVPAGVTSISVLAIGGGGGGGGGDDDKSDEPGGGGGGGSLAYGSWTTSAGTQYSVTIGSGGSGGNQAGGSSGGTTTVSASETESASGTISTNTINVGTVVSDLPNVTLYHRAQKLTDITTTSGIAIDTTTSTNVAIGRANAGAAGNIDGEVAKVLIYNRELSHAEIGQIYNAKCVALGFAQVAISTETASSNPTYEVSASETSIWESASSGATTTVFTTTTTNVANGTTLYWTVTGTNVTAADFTQNTTSGSFTINNNTGSVTLTARADGTNDDKESFTFEVRTGSTSGTVVATSGTISLRDGTSGA